MKENQNPKIALLCSVISLPVTLFVTVPVTVTVPMITDLNAAIIKLGQFSRNENLVEMKNMGKKKFVSQVL